MTLKEISRRLRVSPDTIRRQRIAGKLKALEWIDPFDNGRPRVSRESFEAYERERLEAAQRIYNQSAPKSSGS